MDRKGAKRIALRRQYSPGSTLAELVTFDGTDGATSHTASKGSTFTATGSAVLSAAQMYRGQSALYIPGGTADYFDSTSAAFNLNSKQFYISLYVYLDEATLTTTRCCFNNWDGTQANGRCGLLFDGTNQRLHAFDQGPNGTDDNSLITVNNTFSTHYARRWMQIGFGKVNSRLFLVVNHRLVGVPTVTTLRTTYQTRCRLGRFDSVASGFNYPWLGYIDRLKVWHFPQAYPSSQLPFYNEPRNWK